MKLAVLSPACLLVGLLGQPEETVALRSKALATSENSVDATALSERHVRNLNMDNNWWHDKEFAARACLMHDVDTPTPTLYTDDNRDQEGCRVWCENEPQCNHWTFNPQLRRCFLKKGPLHTEARKGYISAPRVCDNSAMTNFGWGSTAPEIDVTPADFALQCREKCEANPGCSHFTWNKNSKKCYLKNGRAHLRQYNGDETSVPCVWYNIGSRTSDERVFHNITTMYQCLLLCQTHDWCTHATWNVDSKNCFMKKGEPLTVSYQGDITIRSSCMRLL
ncbi:hypothetical protein BESB_044910 [Besnoitia besnoiti]|uniref:Apple domain-containing protein n=1 Tax=Besnoitia besnoiti TaxID=94643 RepID=A0A2A9MEJ6_BESBE|nr:hypothetical protein BESB_044910 [Besnoitia besnoiti]PFH36299.1 hypothetical protein BESB_044910 [Besnoitia besnoiti]